MTEGIPYVDLAAQHAPLKSELLEAVAAVLDSGQFIQGSQVKEFEGQFAGLCGVRFAVALNSGTDALILGLRALNIGPGDEVVTVPNTFVATVSAIALTGARPVLVDVGDDYNMDPDLLMSVIGPRTRAILPVHLTGRPAEMRPIMEAAARHGLYVLEDCAQAIGARYQGKSVGSFGQVGCFSLHPLKTLNACGDGGVVTTDDPDLCARLALLHNLGLKSRDECEVWSGHSRLDTVQAAMLLVKLRYWADWTKRRRANADLYRHLLADVSGVRTPQEKPHEWSVYHTFVIRAERRDALRAFLAERGVGTAIHYPIPVHLQPAARSLGYSPGAFPMAERQAREILSLPVYPELTSQEIEHVAQTIRAFYRS